MFRAIIIYCIINLLNGKRYVGQTIRTLEQRFKEHCKNRSSAIGQAIAECGVENFRVEILEECKTIEQLNTAERYWIAKLNCRVPKGYNVRVGGFGFIRKKAPKEIVVPKINNGKMLTMTIQDAFRRFRKEQHVSQAELASTLGLTQTSYNYEKNSRKSNPSAEVLMKIADTYNVSVDYLLGRTDNPFLNVAPSDKAKAQEVSTESPPKNGEIQSIKDRLAKVEAFIAKIAG